MDRKGRWPSVVFTKILTVVMLITIALKLVVCGNYELCVYEGPSTRR